MLHNTNTGIVQNTYIARYPKFPFEAVSRIAGCGKTKVLLLPFSYRTGNHYWLKASLTLIGFRRKKPEENEIPSPCFSQNPTGGNF